MIPHVVHRIWVGGPEPEWLQPYAATWAQPGWTVMQWTDTDDGELRVESLFPLRNQEIYDAAEQITPDHVGQLRSDILRYEILHRYGGLYVDADFECLRPIDDLVAGFDCFAVWERTGHWIANGLLGATPHHPFLDRLIAGLPENVRTTDGRPNKLSGPQYLTRLWKDGADGGGLQILPERLFFPYGYRDVERHSIDETWPEDAYAVHHWHNKRRRFGIPVA